MFDFFGIEQTSLAGGGGSSNFCREGVGVEEGDPLEEKLTAEWSQPRSQRIWEREGGKMRDSGNEVGIVTLSKFAAAINLPLSNLKTDDLTYFFPTLRAGAAQQCLNKLITLEHLKTSISRTAYFP